MRTKNDSMFPMETCAAEYHIFEVDGRKFAYETNSMAVGAIPPSGNTADFCLDLPSQKPRPLPNADLTPRHVVLGVTHACQLRCKYCFVDEYYSEGLDVRKMEFKTAREFLSKHLKGDSVHIGFFGGEPLLNMDLIKDVVCYASDHYKRCSFGVTTNGLALLKKHGGQTNLDYLAGKRFSGVFSIDGPQQAHDEMRVFADGSGSWEKVMAALRATKGSGFRPTLRATFSANIVNSGCSLKDRVQFLNELLYDGIGSHVSVEPVALTESSCVKNPDAGVTVEQVAALESQYVGATKWLAGEFNAGRKPSWHQVVLYASRLFYRNHAMTECGAGKGYMAVNAAGDVFSCHREMNSKIGSIAAGIDEDLREKWVDNRIQNRQGCVECPIRFCCGGGCREESIGEFSGSMLPEDAIRVPVPAQCGLKMLMFKSALLLLDEIDAEKVLKNPRKTKANTTGKRKIVPPHLSQLKPAQNKDLSYSEPCIEVVYMGHKTLMPLSAVAKGGSVVVRDVAVEV